MTELTYDRGRMHLSQLKPHRLAAYVGTAAEEAEKQERTCLASLDRLLGLEASVRYEQDVAMITELAHFPFFETMDEFDFSF